MKMSEGENKCIVQPKSCKSVRIALQLTDKEIKAFDKKYSLFDVNFDI